MKQAQLAPAGQACWNPLPFSTNVLRHRGQQVSQQFLSQEARNTQSSGVGREHGRSAIEAYTELKSVCIAY